MIMIKKHNRTRKMSVAIFNAILIIVSHNCKRSNDNRNNNNNNTEIFGLCGANC